jgi:exonuclease SbcD
MIKFMYSTDWHTKSKSPSTRTDDFPSTIEAKITNWFQMGHQLGVDFFLCGGDFFDTPYTSDEYVIRIGKIIEKELKGKHLYGIWGNHDIQGWNPNTVTKSPIGVFQTFSPYFTILTRNPTILTSKDGQKVKLTGVSSYAQLDRHILDPDTGDIVQHRSRDWVVEESDGTPHVHIVHGYLSPKPILDTILHTVIDEMKHTKATITLGAHEHTGFPITKTKHGLVYNPGALGRVFASHAEMNRMPKYVLCTINDDGTPELKPIQCPIAKDGQDVMDRTALDEKKAKEAILEEAKGNIREILKGIDIKGIDLNVIMSAYEKTTSHKVFLEAKRRLGL